MTVSTDLLQRFSTAEDPLSLQQYSILLADGDCKFRQGLRLLLEFYNANGNRKCVVVGEAASGAQALHLSQSQHPSLIILDVGLENSWEATVDILAQLQQQDSAPHVLLVNNSQEPDHLFEGMQAGASGYLTKDRIATELLQAISTIAAGQVYLSTAMVNMFFYLFQSHAKQSLEKCKLLHLSKREQEVLKLLARGESNEEIAGELFISVATVKSHFTSIFEKLGVKSRTQAIIRALRLGLVS
ncbi:MAG: response regulator transcription factor [Cyanobacteria bacterium P01_D01_bin.156]